MATQTLMVTVDFDRIAAGKAASPDINILKLLAKVPTAEVLSGDPMVALRVRVDAKQQKKLRAAVQGFCIVDEYADLDLY